MKLLFWSVLILAAIWFLMKKKLGAGNDLTAHFEEQQALQSIGNTSLGANQIGLGDWPLATLGSSPLAGLFLDPFDPSNPFTSGNPAIMYQSEPSEFNGYNPGQP